MTAALVGLASGMALGGAYFLALWATVRRVVQTRRPGTVLLVSYLGRLAIAAVGLYGVVRLVGATGLLAALVGFLMVRHGLMRRIAPSPEEGTGAVSAWRPLHATSRSKRWT